MKNLTYAILHSLGCTHKNLRDIPRDHVEDVYNNLSIASLGLYGVNVDKAIKMIDKNTIKYVEDVDNTVKKFNISIVHKEDEEFPSLLRVLPDCPTILYVRGVLPMTDANISLVGSRKHSQYAVSAIEKIVPELISAGYGIISGGAYGIDSVAHSTALKHKGYTAAVFGSGIDLYYPPSNHNLFEQIIAQGGALISQFPLGTLAEPFNFPIRNALVAGISRGTLIAEAGEDSGTLITARLAVEANRDVFVIPSDITRESSRGGNSLIRDGLGKLVMSAADILCEYQIVDQQMNFLSIQPEFSDPIHSIIYESLCKDSMGIDMISEKLSLELSVVVHALSLMEIEGYITSSGGLYRVM